MDKTEKPQLVRVEVGCSQKVTNMNDVIVTQSLEVANKQTVAIQYKSVPVMTTEQLAEFYDSDEVRIRQNFIRNANRFEEGKHFFKIEGNELRSLKNSLSSSKIVSPNARSLILWTEKGAARHAKILETDQAWDVFEQLEDVYFAVKEQIKKPQIPQTFAEALQLAADQAKQLELAAPKIQYFDTVVERSTLLNATQVAQKIGLSAIAMNKALDQLGVYSRGVKRARVFQQWFIDQGLGELKQTDLGYSQPMFTTKGEAWVIRKLVSEGVAA